VADLVVLEVVRTEAEAELLTALLESAGIESTHRLTNVGAGAFEGLPGGGPREVVVRAEDAAAARQVLTEQREGR
jgi:Putative prokaryotic signal transducing protein